MLFHTWQFFFFFLVVYLVYLALRRTRFYLHWLLAASYFFYAWWNPLYLLLMAYATAVNYYAVVLMSRSRAKKLWLTVGVVNSLGVLGFFKYGAFLANSLNSLFHGVGITFALPSPEILLPIGISFYTFHTLTYTIDYYRGKIEREPSLIRFATFVSLFPQLVAGPIMRAKDLLPQLTGTPRITRQHLGDGLSLFVVGLFKKVALADYLCLYVDKVYSAPELFDSFSLILATFAFGWQIYFDFSGYTDMARGIARLMGFDLAFNFNNPYLASSLGDFWKRWHISLSTWFRDYVYIPLGGNRHGEFRTYANMFLTMVISGLWHGAAWGFVIWGTLHAIGRCFTRGLEETSFYRTKVPTLLKQMAVFGFVTFAWIFFRAGSWSDSTLIVRKIFTTGLTNPNFPLVALFFCLSVWLYQFLFESRLKKVLEYAPARAGMVVCLVLYLLIFSGSSSRPFVYFQF